MKAFKMQLAAKITTVICGSLLITSCATSKIDGSVTSSNFESKIDITQQDYAFYAGKYLGNENDCFPKIPGRTRCKAGSGNKIYSAERNLQMEHYSLHVAYKSGGKTNAREFLFYAAADLATQRGFGYFTELSNAQMNSCTTNYSGVSSGNVILLDENLNCFYTEHVFVLLFNDPNDLKNGVFYKANSGIGKTDTISPMHSLYRKDITDAIEGIEFKGDEKPITIGNMTTQMTYGYVDRAWKNYYDANGIIEGMKNKHPSLRRGKYKIEKDEEKSKKSDQNNVIKNNLRINN